VHVLESQAMVLTFWYPAIIVSPTKAKTARSLEETFSVVDNLFGYDMHPKQVVFLSNATDIGLPGRLTPA